MDQLINEAADAAQADRRDAVTPQGAETVKKVNARRVKTERKPRAGKASDTAPVLETPHVAQSAKAAAPTFATKETPMQFDPTSWMKSFTNAPAFASMPAFANMPALTSLPGTEGLQAMFAEAGSRGQQVLERTRTVAEEVTAMARANIDALAETGRIAAAGAKSLSETAMERSRDGLEQAAAEVKSLTEAQSPTEFFQRQSELAKISFDRAVAEGSRFTESMVKLAGEAMQPLSSQAAVNAERLNTIVD